MESSKTNKHQYSVLLMTRASPASGKSGSVSFDSMLKQSGKDRFLKASFMLATVDGRHRRPCSRKLVTFELPATERATRLLRIAIITALDSKAFTDHKLLKLSTPTNELSRLVLQGLRFKAVMKSLVQYRKTLDSSYSVFSQEAVVTDVTKHLVTFVIMQGAVESSYRRYVRVRKLVR